MYRAFYQLTKAIDRKDLRAEELFMSEDFNEAISRLEFMKKIGGFAIISGRPGVGKTTVVRHFIQSLNSNSYKVAYAPLSTVSARGFYEQLAHLLAGYTPHTKTQLFRVIQESIMEFARTKNTIPVIIFDDAHLLDTQNFFELQLLSNFNFDSLSPALFILIAQPHLMDRLRKPVFEAFYQRIRLHIPLRPFSQKQTTSFISHIMEKASSSSDLFSPKAVELIFETSEGICRKITRILEQALIFGAANKLEHIDENVIYQVSTELNMDEKSMLHFHTPQKPQ
jgi:type II secretory pathway predicted ATPase ExeA